MTKKIAVLVGSLRKESYTRKVAKELIKLAPSSLDMKIVEIGQLPLYNEDEDTAQAKEWIAFRETMKGMDGVIFATPEYNRSIPGVLKNAIDVGSRPYGSSIWGGKAAAVISISQGAIGGFGANQHLRQTFVFLDIRCMQQPEAYLSNVQQAFDADGIMKNESTTEFLKKYIHAYANWVELFAKGN